MTTQQKAMALRGLTDFSIKMRQEGDWYVSMPNVEVGDGRFLASPNSSSPTPDAAIEACWDNHVTKVKTGEFIVKGAYSGHRRQYRWNGYMWAEVPQ